MREEEELLHSPKDLPWHSLGNGAHYRLLRVSPETGQFSIILKLDAGECLLVTIISAPVNS